MTTSGSSDVDANGSMSTPGDGKTPAPAKRRYALTPKALAARRVSSKKSTGPKSASGKERSRRNALKRGLTAFKMPILVWGEDATAYDELYQTLLREHPPVDAIGQFAVRQLTNAFWRSRRIEQAEWALLTQEPHRQSTMPSPQVVMELESASLTQEPHRKSSVPFRWDPGFGFYYLRLFYPGLLEKVSGPTPIRIEDTDEGFWMQLRKASLCLGLVIPEIAGFASSEATEASLARFHDAVARMGERIVREFPKTCEREQTWELARLNACLVPDEPKMELLIRYSAMNRRNISFYLGLIADHCGRCV